MYNAKPLNALGTGAFFYSVLPSDKEGKMKKNMLRTMAALLCLLTAVAFMPVIAFADENADAEAANEALVQDVQEEVMPVAETAAAAKSVKVKMTVNNKGRIAKTKKGKIMANKTVTVVDINKDGVLTFDEALVAAHKAYNKASGYKTADSQYGLTVSKLWGISNNGGYYFFINGTPIASDVGTDTVKAGDRLYASIFKDTTGWSDLYTQFNKSAITVKVKKTATLHLSASSWGYDVGPIEGIQIGKWSKGKFVALKGVKTDANGDVKIKFKKRGTYYVTAKGTASMPIMAPVCKVTVKK